jgi:formate/nitrite transporter FocA (FNT family)
MSGETVQLSGREEREAERRRPLRAAVVFETIRREGDEELERPALSLAASGLAAGLSMGFSLVALGLLHAMVPEAPWKPLVVNLGYTIGFLIVVLGRQQLFTENTLTVVLPFLDDSDKGAMALKVARLWAIVLAANLVGAALFALAVSHTDVFSPTTRDAFEAIGREAIAPGPGTIFVRGIFAAWLIALMVWLQPAADQARPMIVIIITYLVGVAGLSHIIAGSVETLYLVARGDISIPTYLAGFLAPVFAGNVIGGVSLVALLNYGQVVAED